MKFIPEIQLDREFITFGRFYELKYNKHRQEKCRSILEIYNRSYYGRSKKKYDLDAVFIMMNPGASQPKNAYTHIAKNMKEIEDGQLLKIPLVETIPDKTQYQVMRIMKLKKWKYVKVINLSDLREPRSSKFYNKIKNIEVFDQDNFHSIFSIKRSNELADVFIRDKDYRVVVAWGVNTKLGGLINLALNNKELNNRVGNNKGTYKKKKFFYYYHPLQRGESKQKKWLKDIIEKL